VNRLMQPFLADRFGLPGARDSQQRRKIGRTVRSIEGTELPRDALWRWRPVKEG